MTKSTVHQVIQRAISDAGFRRRLREDPRSALQGYDLSPDERTAVTSADPTKLTRMGVDQRMSKAFAVGAVSEASRGSVADISSDSLSAHDSGGGGALASSVGDPLIAQGTSASDALVGAPSHLQIVEGALDTVGAQTDVTSAGWQSPDMIDQLNATSGEVVSAGSQSPDTIELIQSASSAATAPTHLQQVEGALDTGTSSQDVTSAGWQSPDMVDQLQASAGGYPAHFGLAGPSDVGASAYPAHDGLAGPSQVGGETLTHLQQVEGDLDTGSATAFEDAAGGDVTRMNDTDGNIDTTSYASLSDDSVEGTQVNIDDGTDPV